MSDRQSVLVIENDPWVRSFVVEKLHTMGCDVLAVDTAEDAETVCQNHTFDLIIKDLPKPFSLDLLDWRLKNSRIHWHKKTETLAASA